MSVAGADIKQLEPPHEDSTIVESEHDCNSENITSTLEQQMLMKPGHVTDSSESAPPSPTQSRPASAPVLNTADPGNPLGDVKTSVSSSPTSEDNGDCAEGSIRSLTGSPGEWTVPVDIVSVEDTSVATAAAESLTGPIEGVKEVAAADKRLDDKSGSDGGNASVCNKSATELHTQTSLHSDRRDTNGISTTQPPPQPEQSRNGDDVDDVFVRVATATLSASRLEDILSEAENMVRCGINPGDLAKGVIFSDPHLQGQLSDEGPDVTMGSYDSLIEDMVLILNALVKHKHPAAFSLIFSIMDEVPPKMTVSIGLVLSNEILPKFALLI